MKNVTGEISASAADAEPGLAADRGPCLLDIALMCSSARFFSLSAVLLSKAELAKEKSI